MGKYSGRDGRIYIGDTTPTAAAPGTSINGELRSWDLNVETDTIAASSVTDTFETASATVSRGNGTITVWWDEGQTDADAGQALLTPGAAVTLHLFPEGITEDDKFHTVPAIITGIALTNTGNDGYTEQVYTYRNSSTITLLNGLAAS